MIWNVEINLHLLWYNLMVRHAQVRDFTSVHSLIWGDIYWCINLRSATSVASAVSYDWAPHGVGAVPISGIMKRSVLHLLTTFWSRRWVAISRLLVFPIWLRIHVFVDGYGQNAIAEFDIKIQLLDFMGHLRSDVDVVGLWLVRLHLQADRIQTFIFSQEFTLRREPEILFGNIHLAVGSHSYISGSLRSFSKRGPLLPDRAPYSINGLRFAALFSDLILGTAH